MHGRCHSIEYEIYLLYDKDFYNNNNNSRQVRAIVSCVLELRRTKRISMEMERTWKWTKPTTNWKRMGRIKFMWTSIKNERVRKKWDSFIVIPSLIKREKNGEDSSTMNMNGTNYIKARGQPKKNSKRQKKLLGKYKAMDYTKFKKNAGWILIFNLCAAYRFEFT